IDLNQLRALVAVLGRGNFSTAAQELGVPRSTVSRVIAALETALGVSIMRRRDLRGVRRAAAGDAAAAARRRVNATYRVGRGTGRGPWNAGGGATGPSNWRPRSLRAEETMVILDGT